MDSSRRVVVVAVVGLVLSLTSGCTWVHVRPEARSIRFMHADDVTACRKVGEVSANVLSKLLFIPRSERKVRTELGILARNEAVTFGGNAVAPLGPVESGSQPFGVYKCPDAGGDSAF